MTCLVFSYSSPEVVFQCFLFEFVPLQGNVQTIYQFALLGKGLCLKIHYKL